VPASLKGEPGRPYRERDVGARSIGARAFGGAFVLLVALAAGGIGRR
jgi:hypothetical protein